MKSTR